MKRLLVILALGWSVSSFADIELADGTILSDSPMWIVTYIEVAGDAVEETEQLLRDQVQASRMEEGNLRFEAVQRISRSNHFVVLETWTSPETRAQHAAADHTLAYRQALQPLLYAPYDERPHHGLEVTALDDIPAGDADTVYVITHADSIPPEQFPPCTRSAYPNSLCSNALIVQLALDSRDHEGNMRFDILTQSNRPNHMTVVEMWQDSETQLDHQSHQEKKDFRDALAGIEMGSGVNPDPQFTPDMLTGSLWDERLYRLINP
ncbi:MAG: hypothetical protein HOL48_02680 [Porticoccaceae bacterium]|jgi:quinol monooxygenase YgiN|nr:hypothetical protein [Porticoccaceae bacterium]